MCGPLSNVLLYALFFLPTSINTAWLSVATGLGVLIVPVSYGFIDNLDIYAVVVAAVITVLGVPQLPASLRTANAQVGYGTAGPVPHQLCPATRSAPSQGGGVTLEQTCRHLPRGKAFLLRPLTDAHTCRGMHMPRQAALTLVVLVHAGIAVVHKERDSAYGLTLVWALVAVYGHQTHSALVRTQWAHPCPCKADCFGRGFVLWVPGL